MSTVGKILTFLILIMSLGFMFGSLAVFATHKNWREVVEGRKDQPGSKPGLKDQLEQTNKKAEEIAKQYTDLLRQKTVEETDLKNQLAKVATDRELQKKQSEELQRRLANLDTELAKAVAAVEATQKQSNNLFAEVTTLRNDIRDVQNDKDQNFAKLVESLDQLHDVQNKLTIASERRDQLAKQVANIKETAARQGINLEAPSIPPLVTGKILAVNSKEKMIEVSIGSDDGVGQGIKLEVFRGSHYLGQIEVLSVKPDRAVAKIVPGMQKAPMQIDDQVTTRFKNDVALRNAND
jgi:hypothetical protein